ncbi:MAG: YggT family protein [Candidatus Gastranaerophilales bacterium]|nr:YggT family protein [Candidatus Gastranaerophilales bacterium]
MGYIIYKSTVYLFQATFFILIVSCFLTWLPNIDWYRQPYKFFYQFSNFFFAPFRKIVPPIYGMDFSPIVAFIVLSIIENVLLGLLRAIFGLY